MKLLLICLELMLVCAHGPVVRSNFDVSKFSGKWYSVLLASDQKEKIEGNGSIRLFVEDIQAFGDDSLAFKFYTVIKGRCIKNTFIFVKTKDGVYINEYNGHTVFHVVETIYDEYMILYLTNYNRRNKFQIRMLYGRTPDLSPELKEKFVETCEEQGVAKENIMDLTQVDHCPYGQDREVPIFFSIILRFRDFFFAM